MNNALDPFTLPSIESIAYLTKASHWSQFFTSPYYIGLLYRLLTFVTFLCFLSYYILSMAILIYITRNYFLRGFIHSITDFGILTTYINNKSFSWKFVLIFGFEMIMVMDGIRFFSFVLKIMSLREISWKLVLVFKDKVKSKS